MEQQNTPHPEKAPFPEGPGRGLGHLVFGWAAPSFAEQVPSLSAENAEHFDKDNAAIVRLHLRGLLSDGERDKAIKRTHRAIVRAVPRKATGGQHV